MQDTSSKKQTKQNYKPNHQQTGLPSHSALPIRRKANNQKFAQISPYRRLTGTTGPNLGGQKPKGKKNSTLKLVKGHLKHNKLKKKKKKAEKYYTKEGTN